MEPRKQPVSPEIALASEVFDQFCNASTLKTILGHHRHLCELLRIKPTASPHFYPKLKAKLRSWKAQALWTKFDKRASHKCYNRGKACPNTRVLIIGAGPCGLRTAIEAQLLGAKVVLVEKRDRFSRNNVLHLWPFVIADLRALGAKKFFGKFCAGSIDHISIRAVQCILLKVALILGVEIHEGVGFEGLVPPPAEQSDEKVGWRAQTCPPEHPVSQYEFDVLIGADGKRNTLEGFKRKEFRGKLAIAITANFINRHSEAEARVQEISGVAFIFNQKFFKDLYAETGIDLENIVYYKDETHYFVMTAKKHSLIDKGVILQDYADTAKLLALENVDKDALQLYAREAADFSTNYMLPQMEFAVNHYGQPDVAMFDFTSMFAAENASRVVERQGYRLLQILVGDSLLEPFWPTGSGCARGFLSSMDACWAIKGWGGGQVTPLDVLAERESIYRILGQTTPENLHRDYNGYTLDPHTRYPNLNARSVLGIQVRGNYDTDDPAGIEQPLPQAATHEAPKKRRRRDSQVHPDTLLHWLKKQVALYDSVHVENMTDSFKNGLVLCAIIHRYRPDLIEFHSLKPEDVAKNNQLAFDTLERELGIPPVMTGQEMEQCDVPDKLSMLSYLSQLYDTFRGEIPHIKHPKLELEKKEEQPVPARMPQLRQLDAVQRVNLLGRLTAPHAHRKRPSTDRDGLGRSISPGERKADSLRRRPNKRRSMERDKIHAGTEDREDRARDGRRGELDENFSGRIKTLEEKLKGSKPTEKKPKDLMRAIGKIEKSDWNVKEIEKKIQENRMGRGSKHDRESVPKWNRQQFDDKFQAVQSKLQRRAAAPDQAGNKYAEIDMSLKHLGKKLKEGAALEAGPRGSNKVSAMAEQFAVKIQDPEPPPLQKSNSRAALVLPAQGGSESCHFCGKRVYLMERLSAVGKFFHRGCFRCEYCSTALRLNNYAFDRDGKYGSRFFCMQHFGMQGKMRVRRKSEELRSGVDKENIPAKKTPLKLQEKAKSLTETPDRIDAAVDLRNTPERIEFENLAGAASDVEEAPSEMDEDEWTDRNFGASAAEGSSDSLSDMSDSEEEEGANEVFEEAIEEPLADETRRLCETWTRRYSKPPPKVTVNGEAEKKKEDKPKPAMADEDEEESDSFEYEESDEELSYHEYESDDDESETATEGEGDEEARELRRQEVRLEVPPLRPRRDSDTATGSDTEVASDYTSESESEEVENSATEIETDSEFEHDGTTPTQHNIPSILIDDPSVVYRRSMPEEPKRVQVRTGHINGTVRPQPAIQNSRAGVRLEFSPLRPEVDSGKSASLSNLTSGNNIINNNNNNNKNKPAIRPPTVINPMPFVNPRRGDYLLNRTHSTEGIASKMSLELKKKYLLGASVLGGSVKKSGSASTLDSKVKNTVDAISEHQKLLNPAPEPSATMQAFLQGTSNLRASPASPTSLTPALKLPLSPSQQSALLLRKQKELPNLSDDFEHICGKKEESLNSILNESTPSTKILEMLQLKSIANGGGDASTVVTPSAKDNGTIEEEADCRPRSPVHETSIVVPDIPWKADDIESDSLSSDGSMSEVDENESDEHRSRTPSPVEVRERTPPRVEIHNSCGELMEEVEESSGTKEKIEVCEKSSQDASESKNVEPLVFDNKRCSLTSDRSSPSTPPSMRGDESESFHNDCTLAAFTETELSDWAQDGVVSEDLEDVEFNINPEFITTRRHRKTKTNRNATRGAGPSMFARIARGEDFGDLEDDPGHVCGKEKDSQDVSLEKMPTNIGTCLLANMDNIEFMDTGEEEESDTDELLDARNKVLLKNSGYVQFVDADDDMPTPIAETPTVVKQGSSTSVIPTFIVSECEDVTGENSDSPETVEAVNKELIVASAGEDEESSLQPEGTTTEETTTTSELATIKDNLVEESDVFYTPQQEPADISPEVVSVEDPNGQSYEDYVRRLQGRISPFSNVRDSIDIRKSRRKNGKVSQQPRTQELITEEGNEDVENNSVSPLGVNSPSTSRKLEEISRERSKQKDLIHEMVMDKLSAQKKSSQERKQRRSNRVPLSPTSSVPPSGPFDSQVSHASPPKEVPLPPKEVITLEMPSVALPDVETVGALSERCSSVHQDLEVPFADDSVLVTEETEEFFTPLTSFKKQAPRHRPVSVHSSFRMGERPSKYHEKYSSALPDTPLTNPEAFSLPDIRKALFKTPDETFKTPVAPPRTRHEEAKRTAERIRAREEARQRARLKSDEELGLSPEDYIAALKQKAARRPGLERTASDPNETVKVVDVAEIVEPNSRLAEDVSSNQVMQSSFTSTASTASSITSPSSTPQSKATFYLDPDPGASSPSKDKKKAKDPERRKSIIQAVSDFFHKKKDSSASPSPPKTPTGKDKFRFKFTKSKDKGKDKPDRAGEAGRSKSETRPPPIPPLPVNYPASGPPVPRASDSFSEPEEDSRATAVSTPTHDTASSAGSLSRRQSRMHRRMARQAQLKRLRMAQEIQRQLEEVEVKQRELEHRGVSVEKALRGEGADVADSGQEDEAELLREWFELVRERSELRRYEHELLVRAEELELEDRHARLQQELRDRLARDDSDKTREDVEKEGHILGEMLEIVERRDSLIALLEEDRQRYQEEDRDFEAKMLAKGLRLSPLRKESHV